MFVCLSFVIEKYKMRAKNQKAQKKAAEAKAEKMAAEQDNTNVNANSAKKTTAPINNSVPPKPNTAKKTTAKGKTTSDK